MSPESKFTRKDIEWLKATIDYREWGFHKIADMLCDNLREAEESDE